MKTQLTISASSPTLEYKEDNTLERLLSKPFTFNTTPKRIPKRFIIKQKRYLCPMCGNPNCLLSSIREVIVEVKD